MSGNRKLTYYRPRPGLRLHNHSASVNPGQYSRTRVLAVVFAA